MDPRNQHSTPQFPPIIISTAHFAHRLALRPTPAYPSGIFICNDCRCPGDRFNYHCQCCNFDLHPVCALRRSYSIPGPHGWQQNSFAGPNNMQYGNRPPQPQNRRMDGNNFIYAAEGLVVAVDGLAGAAQQFIQSDQSCGSDNCPSGGDSSC